MSHSRDSKQPTDAHSRRQRGLRRRSMWLGLAVLFVLVGCNKPPPVAEMGNSAEVGGMAFSVLGYSVVQPDITSEEGVYEYSKPVLAVTIRLQNTGKESFRYVPAHGGRQMTEASSPLLYYAPEGDKPLPPAKKSPLKGVVLEEGALEGQVTTDKKLAAGDSVTDRYLFALPSEKKAELILSMPPAMHRGDKPVLHRISYSYEKPEGPPVRQLGETVALDGVSFTLDSAQLEYVELKGSGKEKGYSSNPLLKVGYTIENTSGETVTYRPGHRTTSGPRPPALYKEGEQAETIPRVKFSSNLTPKDQVQGTTSIEAGSTVEDYALFEKPADGVSAVRFEYPAARFRRTGLIRYQIPIDKREVPEPPDKLKEQLDESESEEG